MRAEIGREGGEDESEVYELSEAPQKGGADSQGDLWQGEETVSSTSPYTSQSQPTSNLKKKDGPAAKVGLLSSGEALSVLSGNAAAHG